MKLKPNFTEMLLEMLKVKDKIQVHNKIVIKKMLINQREPTIIEDKGLLLNETVV